MAKEKDWFDYDNDGHFAGEERQDAFESACEKWFAQNVSDMHKREGFSPELIFDALASMTDKQMHAMSAATHGYGFGECQDVERAVGKLALEIIHAWGWSLAEKAIGD